MKIYVTNQGITLIGKATEIKATIKAFMKQHKTVKEWTESNKFKKTYLS